MSDLRRVRETPEALAHLDAPGSWGRKDVGIIDCMFGIDFVFGVDGMGLNGFFGFVCLFGMTSPLATSQEDCKRVGRAACIGCCMGCLVWASPVPERVTMQHSNDAVLGDTSALDTRPKEGRELVRNLPEWLNILAFDRVTK